MRTYDLSPLYRTAIGFDRLARLLNDVQRNEAEVSYPPYNIELISDDQYRIVMAVAGFEMSELEIETEHQSLKVVGRQKKKKSKPPSYTVVLPRAISSINSNWLTTSKSPMPNWKTVCSIFRWCVKL